MESDVITLQELFEFKIDEVTRDGTIVGGLRSTGLRPAFLEEVRAPRPRASRLPVPRGRGDRSLDAARPGRRPAVKRIAVVVGLAGILAAFAVQATAAAEKSF